MTVEFLAEHQLYIVMIIVIGIWLGLFAYLYSLDVRLKRIERHTEHNG